VSLVLVSVMACAAGDPERNRKEGLAFLEANAKKEGVMVTPSGLQYKILGLFPDAAGKMRFALGEQR